MLRRLFGRKTAPTRRLIPCGSDDFGQDVVGESFHRAAIATAVARFGTEFVVVLVPEPGNQHDPNAVAVHHAELGRLGHLPREDAAEVADELNRLAAVGEFLTCHARAIGPGIETAHGLLLDCDLTPYGGSGPAVEFVFGSMSTVARTPEQTAFRELAMRFARECQDKPLDGTRIALTGALVHWDRDEAEAMLSRLGAWCTRSVSRKTTYLVCGESPGSKLEKADSLGTTIYDEAQFIETVLRPLMARLP